MHDETRLYSNPFSGIPHSAISKYIVPRFDLEEVQKLLQGDKPLLIEFNGKKGRGKSTHLYWLRNELIDYPLYDVESKEQLEALFKDKSPVILIDSIHKLTLRQRLKLYRLSKKIIFTTHTSRKLECKLVGANLKSISFKGLQKGDLSRIVSKRLKNADGYNPDDYNPLSEADLVVLIKKSKDDIRAIINGLYDKYQ